MLTNGLYRLLETALDYGIKEQEYWEMTVAEVERAIASAIRVRKREQRDKASFDYLQADLIGRSISRIYSSSSTMPTLADVYPSLFDKKVETEKLQERKDEASAARFRQFALIMNKKMKEGKN